MPRFWPFGASGDGRRRRRSGGSKREAPSRAGRFASTEPRLRAASESASAEPPGAGAGELAFAEDFRNLMATVSERIGTRIPMKIAHRSPAGRSVKPVREYVGTRNILKHMKIKNFLEGLLSGFESAKLARR